MNFPFSISKSRKSIVNTAHIIQFPVKLAFACTAHKIQGATIPKPMKIVIDVRDIWQAAICYVMLSRICALWQLYILNTFDEKKMYPLQTALIELDRLEEISLNRHSTEWEKESPGSLKISSLNCRSLKKHFDDIINDELIMKGDIICLQETWLEPNDTADNLQIPGYILHLNSYGKGKGIAIYFKENITKHQIDIKENSVQISKLLSPDLDIVVLYMSQT